MGDLREWEAVDEYEIVLGPVAAHRKACEFPARHDSRQADEGAHHVAAAAGRVTQLVASQEAVRYRAVGIGSSRSAYDDDLFVVSRLRPQLETKPPRSALDHPNGRLYPRNVAVQFSAKCVEAVGQILEVRCSVGARGHTSRLATSGFGSHHYTLRRPASGGVDDIDRHCGGVSDTEQCGH